MSTTIRPEVSKKSKYWISKHRYYELKHFCLQYPEWKELYQKVLLERTGKSIMVVEGYSEFSDPTEHKVSNLEKISANIEIIEKCTRLADDTLCSYILLAVTKGYSYNYLRHTMNMPCCRDMYYDRYRRFFWILSQYQ